MPDPAARVRAILALAGLDLSREALARLSDFERALAVAWASREHRAALGQPVTRTPRPAFLDDLARAHRKEAAHA